MSLLNVGSTDDSCNKQTLETELTQLKDTVTSLKVQNDRYTVTNVNLNRCYKELSKANTYLRTTSLEKIAAQKVEIATLNAKTVGNKTSGTTKHAYPKVIAPGMYAISPKDGKLVVQIVLWYLDSGCSRHMIGDRLKLINYVEKFIGTMRFKNDQFAKIVSYGDYKLGDTIISRVYHVEGLNHNLFSVEQFCNGGLEVAFRQHTCYIRNMDKSKKASHPIKTKNTNVEVLSTLHMNLYGPMRTESINKKKYVLVIVDDYTRFGWVRFLRTKDETLEVFLKLLKNTQRALNATV
nr:integrase, catalytic region, zinc finger, CCHC-type, peptidase aspartic, catalytic [Tanacetum cinerariifolium]